MEAAPSGCGLAPKRTSAGQGIARHIGPIGPDAWLEKGNEPSGPHSAEEDGGVASAVRPPGIPAGEGSGR